MARLEDVARYVRSKTAGPFWVTIDVFCDDDASFSRVVRAPGLAPAAVARLYGVSPDSVRLFPDPKLKVLKVSFPRPVVQGSAADADSHGGQYFVRLLDAPVAPD